MQIGPDYAEFLEVPAGGQNILALGFTQCTNVNVSEDLVYAYVKGWLDNAEAMKGTHATIEGFQEKLKLPSYIPHHDGAIKALKEAGIWTAEQQAAHEDALARAK